MESVEFDYNGYTVFPVEVTRWKIISPDGHKISGTSDTAEAAITLINEKEEAARRSMLIVQRLEAKKSGQKD